MLLTLKIGLSIINSSFSSLSAFMF